MKFAASILISLLLAGAAARALAQETNSDTGPDLKSFDMLWRKNIFDQTRVGIRSAGGPERRQPSVDRVILHGVTVGLGEAAANFGGNDFLKVGDHIRDFELAQITPDQTVKLTKGTNTFVLDMETHRSLRRVGDGPWETSSEQAAPVEISTNAAAQTASATSNADDAAHPGETPILRKLRLRREQEEK
jgi:hypothetical protein